MPETESATSYSKASLGVLLLLICSLGINLLLGIRVSRLNGMVESLRFGNDLSIGTRVPGIQGRLLGSGTRDLEFTESRVPTLLYVFRPDCGWCQKNLSNLRTLIAASGARYRIVGLALPSIPTTLESYLQTTQLKLPVYTDIAETSIEAYHLGGTPETIVVSPKSEVLRVWIWAYQGPMLKDIENYLRVRLRECCQTAAKGS